MGIDTITHAQEAIKIYEEAEISVGLDTAWYDTRRRLLSLWRDMTKR